MSDAQLFAFGCAVLLTAGIGAFLAVYKRFREAFFRANPFPREQTLRVERRSASHGPRRAWVRIDR